jgi:hypothetical protein
MGSPKRFNPGQAKNMAGLKVMIEHATNGIEMLGAVATGQVQPSSKAA